MSRFDFYKSSNPCQPQIYGGKFWVKIGLMPWDDYTLDYGLWDSVALWKSEATKRCERHVICRNLLKRLACSSPMSGVLAGLVTHYCALLCFFLKLVLEACAVKRYSYVPKGEIQNRRLCRDSLNNQQDTSEFTSPLLSLLTFWTLNLLEVSHE